VEMGSAGEREEADTVEVAKAAEAAEAEAEAEHHLVMAAARRIIASDAAIIHRLGTI